MFYLCLAFTAVWVSFFVYLFYLDAKLRNLRRRLDARSGSAD